MVERTKVPDGKGGWTEVAVDTVTAAQKADAQKQADALAAVRGQEFIDDAATLTERIMRFDRMHIQEKGLTKEHRAFAAALYCVNLRETYPDGPAAFDAVAAQAAEYYDANKDKVDG